MGSLYPILRSSVICLLFCELCCVFTVPGHDGKVIPYSNNMKVNELTLKRECVCCYVLVTWSQSDL